MNLRRTQQKKVYTSFLVGLIFCFLLFFLPFLFKGFFGILLGFVLNFWFFRHCVTSQLLSNTIGGNLQNEYNLFLAQLSTLILQFAEDRFQSMLVDGSVAKITYGKLPLLFAATMIDHRFEARS